MESDMSKRVKITLADHHFKALITLSKQSGYRLSELIKQSLDDYLAEYIEWDDRKEAWVQKN